MEVILYIIGVPVSLFLIISPFYFTYLSINGLLNKPRHYSNGLEIPGVNKFHMMLMTTALIAIMFIFGQGIQPLLYFIPGNVGNYDEYGDFMPFRQFIGMIIGLCAAFGYFYLMNNFKKNDTTQK